MFKKSYDPWLRLQAVMRNLYPCFTTDIKHLSGYYLKRTYARLGCKTIMKYKCSGNKSML